MAPTGSSLKALSDSAIQVLTFDRRVPVHEVVKYIEWQLGKGFSFLPAVALQAPYHPYSSPSSCKDAEGAAFSASSTLSASLAACSPSSFNS